MGNTLSSSVLNMPEAQLLRSYQTNAMGFFRCAKEAVPDMVHRQMGTVLVSSATRASRKGSELRGFAAGKSDLRALTQSLTKEYTKDGVHVVHVRLDLSILRS